MTLSAAEPLRGTRMSRADRREQLLLAARAVFVARGYHAAGMDEIADRAGVSKPVLYQHFPSKLDLYLALLDRSCSELEDRVVRAMRATTVNRERVHGAIAAYFDFVRQEGQAYRLVLESDLRSEPQVRNRVEASVTVCMEAVAQVIADDTGADGARAHLLAVGLVGLAETSSRYWLDSGGTVPQEEAVRLLSSLAWRGISGFPRQAEQTDHR